MKTIDYTHTDNWIFKKSENIAEWAFYKKISCPDSVDIDSVYETISNEVKEEREAIQQDYFEWPPYESRPYFRDEHCRYNDKKWISNEDNNTEVPGTGDKWREQI